MAFVLSVPAADVWQDAAWEARQRRLLTAQFGPNEVPGRTPTVFRVLGTRLVALLQGGKLGLHRSRNLAECLLQQRTRPCFRSIGAE